MEYFDYRQYLDNYPDLREAGILDIERAWNHYLKFGKRENRTYKKIKFRSGIDVLVVYVYYERKNQQKNQTNLSFFLKYGLDHSNWGNKYSITTLIVINGKVCEVVIPSNQTYILAQENCSDYEGWLNGIQFMENKINCKIHEGYDYLVLMNAGTCGPIFDKNEHIHWLDPFINKLKETNTVACSPFMNIWPESTGHPGPALSCHFTVFKLNPDLMDSLIKHSVIVNGYSNPVLSRKNNKLDAIFTGEMALSKVLSGKISALYYNNADSNVERREYSHPENDIFLSKTIFIKNIWRVSENSYGTSPVLYHYCSSFIDKALKQKNPLTYSIDYSFLKCPPSGMTYSSKTHWNSKIEYHSQHGHAEQDITFPIKGISNGGLVIYTHYHPDNILLDCNIQSIKILMDLGYSILFFTASGVTNVDLPFEVYKVPNRGVGTDWRMFLEGLKILDQSKYQWVMFVNDSLILGINGISNFEKTINAYRNSGNDFWGQWFTNHVGIHLVGTPVEWKIKLVPELIHFIELTLTRCRNEMDYITQLEIGCTQNLLNKGYTLGSIHNDSTFKMGQHGFFEPKTMIQWINHPDTFAVKWKYSISYLNSSFVSPEFNYLTRFLFYGPYGTVSKGEHCNVYPKSIYFSTN